MFGTVLVRLGLSGHSLIMHWAGLLLLSLLPLLAGCGSSTSASDGSANGSGGNYTGGQTGSLMPSCGIARLSQEGDSVPSGEQAFVFDTRGCTSTLQLSDIVITNAGGEQVAVEAQALDDGVYLIKGAALLPEGEYDVTLPAGVPMQEATIAVAEPAPLPSQVGQLQPVDQSCANSRFTLQPDAALLPYLPLVQFAYRVDGGPLRAIGDYGALGSAQGSLLIFIEHCSGAGCLPTGTHELSVTATIAGETLQPDPAMVMFEIECNAVQSGAGGSNNTGCTVRSNRRVGCRGPSLLVLVGLCLGAARRYRRGRRRSV